MPKLNPMENATMTAFRLSEKLLNSIDKEAKKQDRDRSWVIRKALKVYLEKQSN